MWLVMSPLHFDPCRSLLQQALARALYSRESVLILDDVLTGLDRETEKWILESVFATDGLLKQMFRTVVLATNSGL